MGDVGRIRDAGYASVGAVATSISSGSVVLGRGGRSVGPRTEAIPGRWGWCVLGLQGQLLVLAHDAFEAARWFCLLEARLADPDCLVVTSTDAYVAALARWEDWFYSYRGDQWGEPGYEPPLPVEAIS